MECKLEEKEIGIFNAGDFALRNFLMVLDLGLVVAAFFAGHALRDRIGLFYGPDVVREIYPLQHYLRLIPFLLGAWAAALIFARCYRSLRSLTLTDVTVDIVKAWILAAFFFSGMAYLWKLEYVSRSFVSLAFLLAAFFLVLERILLISLLRFYQKKGHNCHYILLVGTSARAQAFIDLVARHPEWGLCIVGLIDQYPQMAGRRVRGHEVIGALADIPDILKKCVVDEVIFIVPRGWLDLIQEPILYCEDLGKRVSVSVDYFNIKKFVKVTQRELSRFHLLTFETTPTQLGQLFIKRLLDILLACAALFILAPVFLLTAILIKISSPGPVFFVQERSSLNGRRFKLFKFRTMVQDAEAKLAALRTQNEMKGPAFKMENDPRVTPLGKWLRKFSVDELPQLFNVLNGDMSFVGPRPPIPAEVEKYEPWHRRRLSMRPGLTCLWQVEGRNKIVDFDTWMKLDLEYIDHWSLRLDLFLFLKTIPVVLLGSGAK